MTGRTMELDLRLPPPERGRVAAVPSPRTGAEPRTHRRAAGSHRTAVGPAADGLWSPDRPVGVPAASARPGGSDARTAGPDARTADPDARTAGSDARTAGPGARTAGPGARSGGPGARAAGPDVRPAGASTANGPAPAGRGGSRPARGDAVPPPSRDALALLRQATEQIADAHRESEPMRRYPAAYLAALRAGAAALAMHARPKPRRGAPRDVWRLLAEVAPELEEWSVYFASCSRTRAAAEAGIDRHVDRRAADDLLRQAERFVARVQQLLPR